MKLFEIINRFLCSHEYGLKRWHWCHGPTAMEPRQVEAEYRCWKCGKIIYAHPARGSSFEKEIAEKTDKQWK